MRLLTPLSLSLLFACGEGPAEPKTPTETVERLANIEVAKNSPDKDDSPANKECEALLAEATQIAEYRINRQICDHDAYLGTLAAKLATASLKKCPLENLPKSNSEFAAAMNTLQYKMADGVDISDPTTLVAALENTTWFGPIAGASGPEHTIIFKENGIGNHRYQRGFETTLFAIKWTVSNGMIQVSSLNKNVWELSIDTSGPKLYSTSGEFFTDIPSECGA